MTEVLARSHHSGATPAPGAEGERNVLPRPVAFWLVAVMTATLLAASSAPSPLYPVFQENFGFSAITLTAIFAVYVLALLSSLLTVGRLSDVVGRRPVLAVALLVEAVAMATFLGAGATGWLVVARLVQGFATGAAIGVLGAYLLDLQPPDGSRLGSLVNSVAPTTGLGVGAIGTGLLVEYAPEPTRLVFAVLTALFLLLTVATAALPETVRRVPGVRESLRPRVRVPRRARRAFAAAVPTMVATWALGGLMLSVGGSLLGETFGVADHAVVGTVLGVFALSGAVAALLGRNLPPTQLERVGTAVLVAGSALFVVALTTSLLGLFVVSAVIAGGGFGSAFLGAFRTISQLAEPHERAALLSAVFVVSYLAFSIPALVAGVLITHIGLHDTSLGYAGLVALVSLAALTYETVARPA